MKKINDLKQKFLGTLQELKVHNFAQRKGRGRGVKRNVEIKNRCSTKVADMTTTNPYAQVLNTPYFKTEHADTSHVPA